MTNQTTTTERRPGTMLSIEQAAQIADVLDDQQMARAVERYDRLLRRGLDKYECLCIAVEAEIIAMARKFLHGTHHYDRRARARRPR